MDILRIYKDVRLPRDVLFTQEPSLIDIANEEMRQDEQASRKTRLQP